MSDSSQRDAGVRRSLLGLGLGAIAAAVAIAASLNFAGNRQRATEENTMAKRDIEETAGKVNRETAAADGDFAPQAEGDWQAVTDEQWRQRLPEKVYYVTRKKHTEAPYANEFCFHKEAGIYRCRCCNLTLFNSQAKFDSGCGWPSFYRPVAEERIQTEQDRSLGITRTEILCPRCGAHLGHVFADAPDQPTGLRYCVNSLSLAFEPSEGKETAEDASEAESNAE